jgi:hypothetical protein
MHNALQQFIDGKHELRIPPYEEDADMVLGDVINELLEARKKLAVLNALVERLLPDSQAREDALERASSEKVIEPCIELLQPVKTPLYDLMREGKKE